MNCVVRVSVCGIHTSWWVRASATGRCYPMLTFTCRVNSSWKAFEARSTKCQLTMVNAFGCTMYKMHMMISETKDAFSSVRVTMGGQWTLMGEQMGSDGLHVDVQRRCADGNTNLCFKRFRAPHSPDHFKYISILIAVQATNVTSRSSIIRINDRPTSTSLGESAQETLELYLVGVTKRLLENCPI